jgi:hypothetical protein
MTKRMSQWLVAATLGCTSLVGTLQAADFKPDVCSVD